MKIGFAQLNPTVGDLEGNLRLIQHAYDSLCRHGADLVITPELALTGYPLQDLIFKSGFVSETERTLKMLQTGSVPLLVGTVTRNPSPIGRPFFNSAAVHLHGSITELAHKSLLPTYDVFDEARYFEPEQNPRTIDVAGTRIGITICEDIWTAQHLPHPLYDADPPQSLLNAGAELIVNLSASPYQLRKPSARRSMLEEQSARYRVPIAYCNSWGGNDQLVFDGHSLMVLPDGTVWQGKAFADSVTVVDTTRQSEADPGESDDLENLHGALITGVRDYLRKCGFSSAVLGLSGGIDSAVTASIAADALGPENVTGVLMPSDFSSPHSVSDARDLASNLGIRSHLIPIRESFAALTAQMQELFAGLPGDTTEENLQARLRGVTLMAISNKFGSLLLTTGNKSELAVGYCTLYGDMCGGLAVISDVPKMLVYQLARHINARRPGRIPENTILKPPSAELKPDQKDQDTLPPYDQLDAILELYVEENRSTAEIIAAGFPDEVVRWVVRRVDLNEYKRAQAAPGLKVTGRAFGMGRRIPIAQRYVS